MNRLKQKVRDGRLALVSGNHETANMVDFAGSLGLFDGVWIDMEHGTVAMEQLSDLSRAADLWGLTSIVRVRATDPALIALTLDQGVDGIIVPHVDTREQAEAAVAAAKFPPVGHRGAAGGRRSYGRSLTEHVDHVNEESFVAVMIEDVAAIDRLPEILQVPHIDMFFVSRHDLAQSAGLRDAHDPGLVRAYDHALEQIAGAGRAPAAMVGEADLEKYLALGVRCLKTPLWQTFAERGARDFVRRVEAAANRSGPA